MRTFLTLLLASFLLALPACFGAKAEQTTVATEALQQADDLAEQATVASSEGVEELCCGGKCEAPAGYCHSDGTCHGNHKEMPVWEP